MRRKLLKIDVEFERRMFRHICNIDADFIFLWILYNLLDRYQHFGKKRCIPLYPYAGSGGCTFSKNFGKPIATQHEDTSQNANLFTAIWNIICYIRVNTTLNLIELTVAFVGRWRVRIAMLSLGFFHWHNPSGRTGFLGSTQPITEMSTKNISWELKAAAA
jgi:hypothetical protein